MSTSNHYRLAVVGPSDTISGLKALGVEVFAATNSEDALNQLRDIKKRSIDPEITESYAVVCVIDKVLTDVDQAEYNKVVAGALPAVVVLPGVGGANDVAIERLRVLALKAVGSAII